MLASRCFYVVDVLDVTSWSAFIFVIFCLLGITLESFMLSDVPSVKLHAQW